MFALIKHDLQHILKQIKIAERPAAGEDLSTLVAVAAQGPTIATPQLLPSGPVPYPHLTLLPNLPLYMLGVDYSW